MQKFFTLNDLDVKGKRVLVRVDYNVPIKGSKIGDVTRLKASIPTIEYLLKNKCKLILMSHLGRTKELFAEGKTLDEVKKELTLKPVAKELENLLGKKVFFAEDSITQDSVISHIPNEDIVLLENIQFHKGETKNDEGFAKKLASLADVYVNDGFGQSHREYASFCAITKFLPSCAGFLVEKEVKQLSKILEPERPFIAIVAGAKEDKIDALKALASKADRILIGGVLANTLLKAKGFDIGASKFDNETFNVAQELIELSGDKLSLPVDFIAADKFDNNSNTRVVPIGEIPQEFMALDIGPETIESYKNEIKGAKTVFWAGPLGVFEMEKFSKGTKEVGEFLTSLGITVIAGGGDTVSAINRFNLAKGITHISTGGGASLEFIEKDGKLPAIVALEEAFERDKE